MKYTFDGVYTNLKRFQNTCKHGLFRDGWTDRLGTKLQSSCWHDSSVSELVLKHETTSSTRLGWELGGAVQIVALIGYRILRDCLQICHIFANL